MTTTSSAARTAAATLLGGVLVATTAAPVGAAVGVIKDPAGDSRTSFSSGDVTKVRVKHAPAALRLSVFHAADSGLADVYSFKVDTRGKANGPEWVISTGTEVEQWRVFRADGWKGVVGDGPVCSDDNDVDFDRQRMKLVVPRACLGRPDRVRVNLVTANDYPGTPVDHAPAKRVFGGWVAAG